MQNMTPEECRSFLLDRVRTAKLATVRADGRPHVVPMWYDLDGETLIFATSSESVKGKNIRRDPRVCLCVDEETPPFAFVLIEGTAALSSDLEELRYWNTRIGGRYMGPDLAEVYGQRYSGPGELLVRVTPTKIVAQKNLAD